MIHVGGELLPRADAKVSVFDSIVQGGDGVWEGVRVYDGKVFALEEHVDRLLVASLSLLYRYLFYVLFFQPACVRITAPSLLPSSA